MNVPIISDLGSYASVARGLARHIFRQCTLERAKAEVRDLLANREAIFLRAVRETIWEQPDSPYRQMLTQAGWSFDTIVDSVGRRGLRGTLETLRDRGVYVSHDEFKGRKPIQRGELTLEVTELSFNNPLVLPSFEARTGGTRSHGSRVPATFDYVAAQRAPAWRLTLEAIGAGSWPSIIWMPSASHGGGLMWWLALLHMGRPALRWFSVTDVSPAAVSRQLRTMFRFGQILGRARGLRVPYPEHASFAAAAVVLDAVLQARGRFGGCAVISSPSTATRMAGLAVRRKVDLDRVVFLVGGEPLTLGKHAEIVKTNARVAARYSFTEAGAIGNACGHPNAIDDMHFMEQSFVLLPDKRPLPDGRVVDAVMLTTLLPSSPMVLLNVDSDDFGVIATRRCGCLWDELGLHTHVSGIRSFSKLTGEGVTVLGTNCVRVIEEILPREFGGRSGDYQLLEVEDADHLTRLYLVVSPAIESIDEERLVTKFVENLQDETGARTGIPPLWRLAQTIRVLRQEPVSTKGGKLLPFHTIALDQRQARALVQDQRLVADQRNGEPD